VGEGLNSSNNKMEYIRKIIKLGKNRLGMTISQDIAKYLDIEEGDFLKIDFLEINKKDGKRRYIDKDKKGIKINGKGF